jgi:hypothetical protein
MWCTKYRRSLSDNNQVMTENRNFQYYRSLNFDIFDLATHCYIENLNTTSYNATKNFISPIIAHTEFLDGLARETVHWFQDTKPRRNPLINTYDMSS